MIFLFYCFANLCFDTLLADPSQPLMIVCLIILAVDEGVLIYIDRKITPLIILNIIIIVSIILAWTLKTYWAEFLSLTIFLKFPEVMEFNTILNYRLITRKKLERKERDAYLAPYNSWSNRRAVLRFVQDIPLGPEDESWQVVNEVEDKLPVFNKTPILIIWGGKDFVFDDDFLAAWESYYPHAEVHRLNDAGHYVADDAHGDVIPIMQQFISKHS